MADRLIEKEVIDADELKQIIEANSPSPLIVPGTHDRASVAGRMRPTAAEGEQADERRAARREQSTAAA